MIHSRTIGLFCVLVSLFSSNVASGNPCTGGLMGVTVDQSILKPLYDLSDKKQRFKKVPIVVFEIPEDPINAIPQEILQNLGSLDAVISSGSDKSEIENYFKGRRYIILNYILKDGKHVPDFYPISEESFAKGSYFEISPELLQQGNPVLFESVFGKNKMGVDSSIQFLSMQKPGEIEMVSASALGFSDDLELRVIGGLKNPEEAQVRPSGYPGFFSLNERGVYLINADAHGNPAGHYPAGQ